jgi:hypothetical protein
MFCFQKMCILLVRNIGGLWYARPEVEFLSSDTKQWEQLLNVALLSL